MSVQLGISFCTEGNETLFNWEGLQGTSRKIHHWKLVSHMLMILLKLLYYCIVLMKLHLGDFFFYHGKELPETGILHILKYKIMYITLSHFTK